MSSRHSGAGKRIVRSAGEIGNDVLSLSGLIVRPRLSLAAENLFLWKQLAFYEERGVRSRRLSDPVRLCLVLLSHLFDWHPVLKVVKPATFIGWHRNAFRLFWKWKSRPTGRPRSSGRDSSVDSENGIGEPDVGTSTDRSGIAAEDRYPIVASNGRQIYAQVQRKTGERCRISELANLPAEPCQTDCCVRFLHRGHGFR
jgi:hypothetical protein